MQFTSGQKHRFLVSSEKELFKSDSLEFNFSRLPMCPGYFDEIIDFCGAVLLLKFGDKDYIILQRNKLTVWIVMTIIRIVRTIHNITKSGELNLLLS